MQNENVPITSTNDQEPAFYRWILFSSGAVLLSGVFASLLSGSEAFVPVVGTTVLAEGINTLIHLPAIRAHLASLRNND